MTFSHRLLIASLAIAPLLASAEGGCGGAIMSKSPAPDMTGQWDIAYDDSVQVKVTIGGQAYDAHIASTGGTVNFVHDGQPISFNLDCSKPAIVCPSEVWPDTVSARHKNATYPHRFHVTINKQDCSGVMVDSDPSSCGTGTDNPDCNQVCDGTLTQKSTEHFGVVNEPGDGFDLLLGAGIATNGVNCGLLGVSSAHADLATSGEDEDWSADEMKNGEVVVGYAGACLWAGDPDMDSQLEALVLGATLEFRTGFAGTKR